MGFMPDPDKYKEGDIVVPVRHEQARIHMVQRPFSYFKGWRFTLCGYRVTTVWDHADDMDFDNYEICGRCNKILDGNEKLRREDRLAEEKKYPSVDHVTNALRQKDRLLDRAEGQLTAAKLARDGALSQVNKLEAQVSQQRRMIQALQESLKDLNQICKDCGRDIWADAGGNYHHVDDPQKGCFLIQPEVIRVSPMYDLPMTQMQLEATGWVDDGKGNQFADRRKEGDRRQLFPDDRRTSADRRQADGE